MTPVAKQKVTLALSEQALTIIGQHASERKRGEFVSACIEEWARQRQEPEGGIMERIEAKLNRLEDLLSNRDGKGSLA